LSVLEVECFDIFDIANFLVLLFQTSVSAFDQAKSAIATVLSFNTGVDINSFAVLSRITKGVTKSRPPRSKYDDMWDLEVLMNYVSNSFWADMPMKAL